MINELADQIWSHGALHEEAAVLLQNHLKRRLLSQSVSLGTSQQLSRLGRSAAILAAAAQPERKLLAYRIATALADSVDETLIGLRYLLLIVLYRLGNFPGARFAENRLNITDSRLPIHIFGETEFRKLQNAVSVGGERILLTDFQLALWRTFEAHKDVSVSAPTSAGKSFAIQQFVKRSIVSHSASKCVFLVPSRALITQTTDDIAGWLSNAAPDFEIVTIPLAAEAAVPPNAVFVMTQERLQLALFNHQSLSFEIAVVDESHGLGEGPRGVLLTSVIDELRSRNPGIKLLFAGPNISNPGDLGTAFGVETVSVSTRDQTVAQNIIFADVDSESAKKIHLSCLTEAGKVALGTVEASVPIITERERLIFIPIILGNDGQGLIYVLGPAQCEDIAFGLADALSETPVPYLEELSNFIADAVHPKYQLVNSVKSGVGFHYGRVPALVRKEIEDAYSTGHLKYLVTTSTLLQGVNMPARNLFMLRPHKGDENPISSIDFWNLAGRAGRLGKEFEGNVFLIDYDTWESKPLTGEKEIRVENAFDFHVGAQTSELLAYIADPTAVPNRDRTDEFENTFVKLYTEYRKGRLRQRLERARVPEATVSAIFDAMRTVERSVTLPKEIFEACPTVSPYRQQALYERIRRSMRAKGRGPAYVIPKHPLSSEAWSSLLAVFKRCQDEILRYQKSDRTYVFVTYLALRWMKGDPLPRIIEDALQYKRSRGEDPSIATVIRQTLTDVEQRLRFEYVRLTTCYNSILRFALTEAGHANLIESIPTIPVYLEVGACTATMMSFMELGISRYTAAKLHLRPARSDLSAQGARIWLKRQDIEALDIPRASVREIRRLGLLT